MMCEQPISIGDGLDPGSDAPSPRPAVLLIGRADAATEAYLQSTNASVVACGFAALDTALLDRVAPDLVVFPLLATGFDAAQVAARLHNVAFQGRALVIAPKRPNREMVLKELRALAPGLSISLIEAGSV